MKKIVLYGSSFCGDTTEVKEAFSQTSVQFEYVDITSGMDQLKAFLKIRDLNESHANARKNGGVGIPVLEVDGVTYTVDNAQELHELIEKLDLA